MIDLLALWAAALFRRDLKRHRQERRMGSRATEPLSRPGETRLHIFSGTFPSETELISYCFNPLTANGPEQLNIELPEVSIDTRFVEAAFGDDILLLLEDFLAPSQRLAVLEKLGDDNAIIIVGEDAFGEGGYALHDTARLRHRGFETVPLPVEWSTTGMIVEPAQ